MNKTGNVQSVESVLKRNEKEYHECGEITCHNCGHNYMSNEQHLCYMRSFTSYLDPAKFIFYDFECTQVDGKHRPNFVVAHSICNECENNPAQLRLHVKTVVLYVLYVTSSMSKKKSLKDILVKDVVKDQ